MSAERIEQFLNSRPEAFRSPVGGDELDKILRDAARILLLHAYLSEAEIRRLETPQIGVERNMFALPAAYVDSTNTLMFDPDFNFAGFNYKAYLVGEELGHWLFGQLHPERGDWLAKNWFAERCASEAVGRLSALIVAAELGEEHIPLEELFGPLTLDDFLGLVGQLRQLNYAIHHTGYSLGEELYREGESFERVLRWDLEDFKLAFSRFGVNVPLLPGLIAR